MNEQLKRWRHPGGKMIALGADKLTYAELLAILINTWYLHKSEKGVVNGIY